MEKYTNEHGKECWRGMDDETSFDTSMFHETKSFEDDRSWALHTNLGSLTVLDRVTGFGYGLRDTETGYRDLDGRFWLASGMYDVRRSGAKTFRDAIDWVKERANTCVGYQSYKNEESK